MPGTPELDRVKKMSPAQLRTKIESSKKMMAGASGAGKVLHRIALETYKDALKSAVADSTKAAKKRK